METHTTMEISYLTSETSMWRKHCHPEDGRSMFLQNIEYYTAQPRRPQSKPKLL
jgi:hypothetical protein